MASFEDMLAALKSNAGAKNSRSPLNDPFYAESLIIQSKSIVGRMYSSNEYVRFKYECELSQLVKQYRVWLAEIKREEREIAMKLDAMRQEQRDISKERRDFQAIQLVAKTNREFINHYKRRASGKRNHRSVLPIPQTSKSFTLANANKRSSLPVPKKPEMSYTFGGKGSKLQKVVRLPKIVPKLDGIAEQPNARQRRTSLPVISSLSETDTRGGEEGTMQTKYEAVYGRFSRQPEHTKLVQGLLKPRQDNGTLSSLSNSTDHKTGQRSSDVKHAIAGSSPETEISENSRDVKALENAVEKDEASTLPLGMVRKPRILSAPKSRGKDDDLLITVARPSSAGGTAGL